MTPLSSYARPCHSPFHTIGLPTTQSDVTVASDMYILIAAGVTSAFQTSAAGLAIVTDALAISPVFIDSPAPPWMARFARSDSWRSSPSTQAPERAAIRRQLVSRSSETQWPSQRRRECAETAAESDSPPLHAAPQFRRTGRRPHS